jgi:hypothetical protein
MAGLWCDHFGQYASSAELLDGVYAENGWALSTANPPRAGASHLRSSGGSQSPYLRRVFGAAKSAAGVAYRFYVPNLPTVEANYLFAFPCIKLFWFLDAAAGCQICVVLGTDGSLVVYRGFYFSDRLNGGAGTLISRSDPCLQARAYNHIEARCYPADSGGTFEVRVNGVTKYNYVGDTLATGLVEVSQWGIGGACGLSGVAYMDIADLHAWDTEAGEGPVDFVGNAGVMRRKLNQDTAVADWALSTGASGYPLLVDKDDATYIEAAATGLKSAFLGEDLPAGTEGIVYQQASWRGLKTDASDCDVQPAFISGAEVGTADAQPMTPAETWRWAIIGSDPDSSGAPWTEAAANASAVQFERTL